MGILKFTDQQQKYFEAVTNKFANDEAVLAANNQGALAVNAGTAKPLPKDFGQQWARDAVEIQRDELRVFNTLNGINRPVDISTFVDHFMTVSDSGEVNVSIDGQSQAKGDQAAFDYHGTPVGMYDSVAKFGWKQMAAANKEGFNLQAPSLSNNQRKVAETVEDTMLNGNDIAFGDAKTYGLRTHPLRNTDAFTGALQAKTGAEFKDVAILGTQKQHAAKFFTGVYVFMNYGDWFEARTADYSDQYPNKTKLQGFMEGLPEGSEVIPSASVPKDELLYIAKRRDVYEILNAMPMINIIKKRDEITDPYQVKVMMSVALELKYTGTSQAGYTQLTKA